MDHNKEMAFIKQIQREIDEALADVKCTLCRKPLGDAIASEVLGAIYGRWGVCHKSCIEQYEADMVG